MYLNLLHILQYVKAICEHVPEDSLTLWHQNFLLNFSTPCA
jgi:hypothetical protein